MLVTIDRCICKCYHRLVTTDGVVRVQLNLSQTCPTSRTFSVKCDVKVFEIKVHSGVVWALTVHGSILVRVGVSEDKKEGLGWIPLRKYVLCFIFHGDKVKHTQCINILSFSLSLQAKDLYFWLIRI